MIERKMDIIDSYGNEVTLFISECNMCPNFIFTNRKCKEAGFRVPNDCKMPIDCPLEPRYGI